MPNVYFGIEVLQSGLIVSAYVSRISAGSQSTATNQPGCDVTISVPIPFP
jgi:hypothetical protein